MSRATFDTLRTLREQVTAEREAMTAAAQAAGDHFLALNPAYSTRTALWSALLTAEDVALAVLDVDTAAAATAA